MSGFTYDQLVELQPNNKRLTLLRESTVKQSQWQGDGQDRCVLDAVVEYIRVKNNIDGSKSDMRIKYDESQYNRIRGAYRLIKTAVKHALGELNSRGELAFIEGVFYYVKS